MLEVSLTKLEAAEDVATALAENGELRRQVSELSARVRMAEARAAMLESRRDALARVACWSRRVDPGDH
jgi:multidrug resistance efflux pump